MKWSSPFVPALIAFLVVIADQLTKFWVLANFRLYESKPVIPGLFDLTFVTNTGAAFGMLAGDKNVWRQLFFVTVSVIALGILTMAFRHYRHVGKLYVVAIGMVGGGALGNLIDRFRYGHVVDFLDFYIKDYHWPAFNAADSAITVGVALFLMAGYLEHKSNENDPTRLAGN